MVTISEIFTYVNCHNAPAIFDIVSNKKNLDEIKWTFKKQSQDILSRCVEVHAKECFDILLNAHIFPDNIYTKVMYLACVNYINYASQENYHYIDKILEKFPGKFNNILIRKLIEKKNVELFKQHYNKVNYLEDDIDELLIHCCEENSLSIFEILFENIPQPQKNILIDVMPNILESKLSNLYLNYLSKYGFTYEILLDSNYFDMTNICFDTLYSYLKNLNKDDLKDIKFEPLLNFNIETNFNFDSDQSLLRFYKLLELPIKYTNLSLMFIKAFPTEKNLGFFEVPLMIIPIIFELKNDEIKEIIHNPNNIIFKKIDTIISGNMNQELNDKIKDILFLIKKNCVLPLDYYQFLGNYKSNIEKEYNKWKKDNLIKNNKNDIDV